ncbi:GNAT family N-acetyltransferase [Limimaricola sp. AA108-03]|uniref:GNAT family N-acetyltransferase n=1 Tax=Limimaricola sp. AA108-03 TaxID=3425945 RepID=UPI003D77B933
MELPDLAPDMQFARLSDDAADVAFAFEAKRAAMGPHIIKRWPWVEAFQRDLHERQYKEKLFLEIRRSEQRLGALSFHRRPDHIRFGEFYLLPEYQGCGIGSSILAHSLAVADSLSLPVRLEYLHWNPVGSLYRRHGFQEIGRSETHCFLQREVGGL